MNLHPQSKSLGSWLMIAVVALAAPASWGQEEFDEEEESRLGSLSAQIETWISQPAGLEYTPATQLDPDNVFGTRLLTIPHDTETEFRTTIRYDLPRNVGGFVLTYYAHRQKAPLEGFAPGQFIFGETLVHPSYAGYDYSARSDAFFADSDTLLRDVRLDFHRPAFRSERASGEWFVGWRRVTHGRSVGSAYWALVPDLPPLVPPTVGCNPDCPDLDPLPDFGLIESRFEGRGPTVGLDVELPLWKENLVFEGGATLTVMRGKTDSFYGSVTSFYLNTMDDTIVGPPFDEFNETIIVGGQPVGVAEFIEQVQVGMGLEAQSSSTTSQVIEIELGLRWKARPWLDVAGGFRTSRYTNVGVDLRPRVTTLNPVDSGFSVISVEDVTEVDRSATYEGFYGAVIFRLF